MASTYTLCVRRGNVVTCKSELPSLHAHKDIGFEDFEDSTKHEGEHEEHPVDSMRWYSAGKGLKTFVEIRAKIAAGERFELPRETIIQISKEIDTAIKDLAAPAKNRLQFHLARRR